MRVADRAAAAGALSQRTRRILSNLYWTSACLLLPWIVFLYAKQPYTTRAHDLVTVSVGVPVAVVGSMLATAWLCHRSSVYAAITATVAASAAFIMFWFHLLTRTGPSQNAAEVAAAATVPFLVLLIWIAVRSTGSRAKTVLPLWVPVVLVVAACLLLLEVIRLALVTSPVHQAHHLRLVWTGLDIFEFVGLAATAWTLRRRSRRVPIAAAYTGTLLLCDAWFNITATTGNAQISAVILAFVEVPIAAGSLLLAYLESRPQEYVRGSDEA